MTSTLFKYLISLSFVFLISDVFAIGGEPAKMLNVPISHPGKLKLTYLEEIERQPPLSSPMRKVRAHTRDFYIFPGVVKPSIQSIFLLEHTEVNEGDTVLDLGTGSGIQAIFAAEKASKVIATDIDPVSVANAQYNINAHNMTDKIEVRQGDLLKPVKPGELFDVVLFNINYPYDEKSQWLWQLHERFFKNVGKLLKPGGRIYYQIGFIRNIPRVYEMVEKNNLQIIRMRMEYSAIHKRAPIVMKITRPLRNDRG